MDRVDFRHEKLQHRSTNHQAISLLSQQLSATGSLGSVYVQRTAAAWRCDTLVLLHHKPLLEERLTLDWANNANPAHIFCSLPAAQDDGGMLDVGASLTLAS